MNLGLNLCVLYSRARGLVLGARGAREPCTTSNSACRLARRPVSPCAGILSTDPPGADLLGWGTLALSSFAPRRNDVLNAARGLGKQRGKFSVEELAVTASAGLAPRCRHRLRVDRMPALEQAARASATSERGRRRRAMNPTQRVMCVVFRETTVA